MKKRILAFMLAIVTALCLVACGGSDVKEKAQVKTREYIYYYTSNSGEHKSGDVSGTTFMEYDKDGNVILQENTDANGGTTKIETKWEKSGDILKATDSNGSRGEYILDKNGNPQKTTLYDSEGNVIGVVEREYKDGVLVALKQTNTYGGTESYTKQEYDANGNVTYAMQEQNKQKTVEREYENVYDEDGKLTSVFITDILDSIDYVDKYEYDEDGHLKTIIYGLDGTRVDVECDEDGNVIESRNYNRDGKLQAQVLTTYYED